MLEFYEMLTLRNNANSEKLTEKIKGIKKAQMSYDAEYNKKNNLMETVAKFKYRFFKN